MNLLLKKQFKCVVPSKIIISQKLSCQGVLITIKFFLKGCWINIIFSWQYTLNLFQLVRTSQACANKIDIPPYKHIYMPPWLLIISFFLHISKIANINLTRCFMTYPHINHLALCNWNLLLEHVSPSHPIS